MAYTGDSGLDPKVQQRIMTAFAEAVRLYREGHPEESLTILRSIADVDAQFKPAQRLEAAINASAPVDLAQLLGEMSAAAGQDAVDHGGEGAAGLRAAGLLERAQPRPDRPQGPARTRRGAQAGLRRRSHGCGRLPRWRSLLGRARDALDGGQIQEAQGFLRLARNLDPSHPELAVLDHRLPAPAGVPSQSPSSSSRSSSSSLRQGRRHLPPPRRSPRRASGFPPSSRSSTSIPPVEPVAPPAAWAGHPP